jgi:hypothetical protein
MKTYKVTVDNDGTTRWYNEQGQLHREGDLPAVEWANGGKSWYINGERNREGGLPAIEFADGGKCWYINGKNATKEEAIAHFKPKEVEWKTFLMEGLLNDVYIQEIMRFKSIENAKELYTDATITEIKLNFDIL